MRNFILITLLCSLFVSQSFAQKGFQGIVNYTIEYQDLPEEMAAMESMLPHTMTLKIKGNKSRMEQNSGMGSNVVISNGDDNDVVTLMNMMGNKVAIKKPAEEVKKEKMEMPDMKITYLDEVKELAGYKCKKAEIKIDDSEDVLIVYYTNKIKLPEVAEQFKGLKGFPMQYEIKNQGLTISMVASSVAKEKISSSEFTIPDDYEIMSMEEFKSKMKSQMMEE